MNSQQSEGDQQNEFHRAVVERLTTERDSLAVIVALALDRGWVPADAQPAVANLLATMGLPASTRRRGRTNARGRERSQ